MADLKTHLKSAAWTEAEAVAVVLGGVAATKILNDEKLFAKHFAENPLWFHGARVGAPFFIKWSGALKAGAACMAATYVSNPWLKLALIGVAVQGTLQQARVMTWDGAMNHSKIPKIGDAQTELDAKLKALADSQRTSGPEYVGDGPQATRYESAVAGPEYVGDGPQATRYESAVAGPMYLQGPEYVGVYDEDARTGWSFESPDPSGAA